MVRNEDFIVKQINRASCNYREISRTKIK